MTTTTYRPKHKRPAAYGGSTPRGPQRWARAAHNAITRPNSQAAKLFYERVYNAHALRKHFPSSADTQSQHLRKVYGFRPGYGYGNTGEMKRQYVTCSLFCTAMVVQLDHHIENYQDLVRFLMDDERVDALRPGTLTRDMSCYFCGSTVKAKP